MLDQSKSARSRFLSQVTQNRELVYGTVLLCQLPSFLGYFRRVWNSGHYQFAVLLIPLVVWMMKERLEDLRSYKPGRSDILGFLIGGVVFTMFLATFVAPMFWILSFMVLAICYVYDRYGNRGVQAVLPIWLVLLIVVPLPRGLDNLLVTKLQAISSEFGSWILDAIGYVHFRNGVVLVTEKDQFFTEEACSGIRSLFSSLGAIGLYCVHKKFGIARSIFSLAQTFFWVLVGNAIRIALVVWISDNWTKSIATGWPHDILGLATFLFILLLVVSTDQILRVVLEMGWPKEQPDRFDDEILEAVIRKKISRPKSWICLVALSLLFGFCGVRLLVNDDSGHIRNPLFAMPEFRESFANDLPLEILGWRQIEFEPIFRGEDVILAAQSYTWKYEKDGVEVVISVDGPWEFWHDITACYRGIGWTTSTEHEFGKSGNQPDRSRIDLSSVTGEQGVVFFAQHDLNGKVVRPSMLGGMISLELVKLNALQSLRTILGTNSKFDPGFRQYELPLSTIQVFCNDSQNLTAEQIQSIDSLYQQARLILTKTARFNSPPE